MKTLFFFSLVVGLMFLFGVRASSPPPRSPHAYGCLPPHDKYTFCNTSLSTTERVEALCSKFRIEELISQLSIRSQGVSRLGVPGFNYTSECPHGVLGGNTTGFPQVIGMAAAFNQSLWLKTGMAISTELRAAVNQHMKTLFVPISPYCNGLNINIFRDPRWGRGQETPGECPFLTSQYVTQFLKGMQGYPGDPTYDSRVLKVATGCKHITAYSLEYFSNDNFTKEYSRQYFDGNVTDQDLFQTYLPAWKGCIQGQARALMCAYVSVNGVPMCANNMILNQIARQEYGFNGFVLPDYDAVPFMWADHHYTDNGVDTVAAALNGGLDMDSPIQFIIRADTPLVNITTFDIFMPQALREQLVSKDQLMESCKRVFYSRFELGLFDPNMYTSYDYLDQSDILTPASLQLALEGAQQSMVLLENKGQLLPIDLEGALLSNPNFTVSALGPLMNRVDPLMGDYTAASPHVMTIRAALQSFLTSQGVKQPLLYGPGCNITHAPTDPEMLQEAVSLAKQSDLAIVAVGLLPNTIEGEGKDRVNLTLPGEQLQLVQQVWQTGVPTVVVLVNGGPVDIQWIKDNVPAVLEAFYPGQMGATAIVNTLFGLNAPAGRLPYTVYPQEYVDQMWIGEMVMNYPPGHTFRYYTGQPLYEFGYGLSYTNFSYVWFSYPPAEVVVDPETRELWSKDGKQRLESQQLEFRVNVTNTGTRASDEVVLAFYVPPQGQVDVPLKELFGFERIHLLPGQSQEVVFFQPAEALSFANKAGKMQPVWGEERILIGTAPARTILIKPRK